VAITLGVHAKAESPFSSSLTTSAVTTQATGSTLVAFAFGGNIPSISDSKSNTWNTPTGGNQSFNGGFGHAVISYVQNATGGSSHTFTASSSGGGLQIMVLELIGAVTTGGYDAFAVSNPTGGTTTVATPSITTVAANAAVVACAGGASSTNNAPTSANGTVVDSISGANFVTGGDSWFIKATAGSTSDTLTFSTQTSYDMAAFTISFAPASTGSSLTANFGSYSLTGQAATLSTAGALELLANGGSYDYQGALANSDLALDAAFGSYILSGQAVTLIPPSGGSSPGGGSMMMLFGKRKRSGY